MTRTLQEKVSKPTAHAPARRAKRRQAVPYPPPSSRPAPARRGAGSTRRPRLVLVLLLGFLLGALAATFAFHLLRLEVEAGPGGLTVAQVQDLETMAWVEADTAWLPIAGSSLPRKDQNFAGGPLQIAGVPYAHGLGTYPQSEITYRLGGDFMRLDAEVGVDDATPEGSGESRFLVFGDARKLFDSGVVRSGEQAKQLRVFLYGVNELRLVTVNESPDREPGFTNWVEPQLARGLLLEALGRHVSQRVVDRLRLVIRGGTGARDWEDQQRLAKLGQDEFNALGPLLSQEGGGTDVVQAVVDEQRDRYILANQQLVVSVGYGGPAHGAMSVFDRVRQTVLMQGAVSSITLGNGANYDLARDSQPVSGQAPAFAPLENATFGEGVGLKAVYRLPRAGLSVQMDVTLYQDASFVVSQLELLDASRSPEALEGLSPVMFDLLDSRHTELALGEPASYITDYGRLRRVRLRPDGLEHQDYVGEGKPVFLWAPPPVNRSIIFAALDETAGPARATFQLQPRATATRIGFSTGSALNEKEPETRNPKPETRIRSPRLYMEFVSTSNPIDALKNFRNVSALMHPSAPIPPWFRYQWNSWYTYYMNVTEDELYRQADYISENLGDLGPWNIAIDAGWYVAEGRDGSHWRAIDYEKFPSGIRPLVKYLHDLDIGSILYFSAPYLDNRQEPGNWLGLAGIIQDHPEWLMPADSDDRGEGYLYDFSNPELRAYMRSVLRDFFLEYGVDGLEVDGLGTIPAAITERKLRDDFGVIPEAGRQTMAIYRFIAEEAWALRPDAYIMAGWHLPLFANPYAQSFFHSDEFPAFSNPYPYGGLLEHIDYSIVQQGMWGQRSHIGYAYGDPNQQVLPRWLLEASIALGTDISMGFDLPSMYGQTLSAFRERWNHYRPHEGELFTVGPLPANVFGRHANGYTYIGVLNRETAPREIPVRLSDIGLDPSRSYFVLDAEENRYQRVTGTLKTVLPPSSFRLFVVRAAPGVMWSNSSYQANVSAREITVKVRGPELIEGFIDIAVPAVRAVTMDGRTVPLRRRAGDSGVSASYDRNTQVVRVKYPHDGTEHEVRVVFR